MSKGMSFQAIKKDTDGVVAARYSSAFRNVDICVGEVWDAAVSSPRTIEGVVVDHIDIRSRIVRVHNVGASRRRNLILHTLLKHYRRRVKPQPQPQPQPQPIPEVVAAPPVQNALIQLAPPADIDPHEILLTVLDLLVTKHDDDGHFEKHPEANPYDVADLQGVPRPAVRAWKARMINSGRLPRAASGQR